MEDPTLEGYLNRKNSTESSHPPLLPLKPPSPPPLPLEGPPPSSPVIVDPPILYDHLNHDQTNDYGIAPIDCYEVDSEGGSTALMQVRIQRGDLKEGEENV